jgi:perosamine synthetase
VPACTYISTLSATILAGCDIVLVDVEIPSGNMSPERLLETLRYYKEQGDPIDIIAPVHLYGKACDPRIFTIAEKFGVWVIEDACESTFTPSIGKGHILTTSFFSNHLISAGGGGMIMTDDDELDEYCWKLVNHGRSARFGNDDIHKIAEKFHFDTWGHSMKWSDLPAAVAKAQIERKDELYTVRRNNAEALTIMFQHNFGESMAYGVAPFSLPDHKDHCFMMYPIVLHEPLDAANVIHYLNEHGVEVRRMMPITNQPIVQEYFHPSLANEFPVADLINRQGFYIGCHPELSIDDMEEMGSIIDEAIKQEVNRVDL